MRKTWAAAAAIALVGIGAPGSVSARPKKTPAPPVIAPPKGSPAPAAAAPEAAPAAPAAPQGPRQPKDDWEAAVFYFNDADAAGWTNDKCQTAADKFQSAGKGKRAEGFFNAGVSLQRCGKTGDAEKLYRKALEIDPNNGPSLANLGQLAWAAGKTQDAQNYFDQAVKKDPLQVSAAYNNLAWIEYQQLRQTTVPATRQQLEADALGKLQRALAIDNDSVAAYTVMALIYMEGADKNRNRLDLADLLLTEGKKRSEKYAPLWNAMGLLQMRRNNVAKALEDFRQAVTLDPSMAEARMNVGQIVLSSRNYDEAETQFREVLKLRKNDYAALVGLGVALRGQATVLRSAGQADRFAKKIDDSESMYKAAMDADKNRADAYYNLGLLYKDYRTNDADQSKNIAQYRKAKGYFQDYLSRADKDDPKRAEATGHMQDCDKYVDILSKVAQDQGTQGKR
jgi:tetratricopeptide (TPR) repeat protein